MELKFVSWNVNGLRACIKKGFYDVVEQMNADFFCVQETKMQPEQAEIELANCFKFWNSAERKGYSGTVIFTPHKPLSIRLGIGIPEHDTEGRVITLEYENFFLVNVYVPNSKNELQRLDYRMVWEDDFRKYLNKLKEAKPVIVCGDMNVAHKEIDLKNPQTNHHNAGFTDKERNKMTELLSSGFVDTYRTLHPEEVKYSWWSYRFSARKNNAGWRIDYFLTGGISKECIKQAEIHNDIFGSDHCPVSLVLDI